MKKRYALLFILLITIPFILFLIGMVLMGWDWSGKGNIYTIGKYITGLLGVLFIFSFAYTIIKQLGR